MFIARYVIKWSLLPRGLRSSQIQVKSQLKMKKKAAQDVQERFLRRKKCRPREAFTIVSVSLAATARGP
jgi:hypothetical protein